MSEEVVAVADPEPNPETNVANRGRVPLKSNLNLASVPASVRERLQAEAPANALFPDHQNGVDGWRLADGSFVALGKPAS